MVPLTYLHTTPSNMAMKIYAFLLLVVVVGCHCKPFGWGFGVSGGTKVGGTASGKASGKAGFKDWKLGAKSDVHGNAKADAEGDFVSYAYLSKPSSDGEDAKGIGIYHDMHGKTGVQVSGDASGNGSIGKGDSLLSLKTGGSKTGSFAPKGHLFVDGDTHLMSGKELKQMADRHDRSMHQVPERYATTTESFFD